MILLSFGIRVLITFPLLVLILKSRLVHGIDMLSYPLMGSGDVTFTRQDYLSSQTFAMLHNQDGVTLEHIFKTLWPVYSNTHYPAVYEDLNEKLFSPMCRKFLAKCNPNQSPVYLAIECTPQSLNISRLGAFCFLLLGHVDEDLVHNRRCESRVKCKRIFRILQDSVEPIFHRLILWMPWDYTEFRLDILKLLADSTSLTQDQIKSLDVFLRCLSKFYYTLCTDQMKRVLLPLE